MLKIVNNNLYISLFLSIFLFFGQTNPTDKSSTSIVEYGRGFDYTHDNWKDTDDIKSVIGTTGGVHILAEPGELIIEVEKRDLNETGRERELRVVLVGPDRRVITEKSIPDDGRDQGSGMGPPQRVRLETVVQRQGVYSMNITVSGGQRNTDIVWGFRTNSEQYIIESASGHRDADHEEPIILQNPEES